ncbi:hypothetical protein K1719_033582 [Acacia pycnantha]|nr:hypothetical protein K1719_033582 [Acacia pycnantha]
MQYGKLECYWRMKRVHESSENIINITLWGECAEETYGKKHEDMEPPITVLVRFARLNRNTDYGHLSNAFNATLVTLNPDIPEAASLNERYKVHYKVYDDTGKCSVIFFDRHATKLLGQSASNIKEAMQKEGRNTTIPKELDEIAGKVVIVKLRIKSHNIKHRTSSIGVTQFCGDNHLVAKFLYSDQEEETIEMVEESAASRQTVCTESQDNVIEDDDNTLSQLITAPEANTKRKTLGNDIPVVCEDLGLAELCTPKMSSTKPMKNIKKEK